MNKFSVKTAIFLLFLGSFLLTNSSQLFAQTKKEQEALASQYFQQAEWEKAADIYADLYNRYGGSYYYTNYFNTLMEIPDYKEAEKIAKKESRKNKGQFRYEVDLGHVYMKTDDFSKADKHFRDLIKNCPASENKYLELSNAFLMRRYFDYSLLCLETAIKELGKSYALLVNIARIYEVSGKAEEMANAYLDILEISSRYENNVKSYLQNALQNDAEGTKNEAIKNALLERTRKNPNDIIYAELLFWHSIQNKNYEIAFIQARSLDKRIDDQGQTLFEFAELCAGVQEYEIAEKTLALILKKGEDNYFYRKSRIALLDIKFEKLHQDGRKAEQKELQSLVKEYEKSIAVLGKNSETIVLMHNLAQIKAFYLHDIEGAIALLEEAVSYTGNPSVLAESKLALADVYLISGKIWDASLLYSQVEKDFKDEPMGHKAKYKNALFYFYIGEFDWANAQFEVLRAATSKLIANDAMLMSLLISDNVDFDSSYVPLQMYAMADFFYFQKEMEAALLALDSIEMIFPGHPILDDVLLKKARIHFDNGAYQKTDSIFDLIVRDYAYEILADKALYSKALLYEYYFKDKEKAMDLYSQLLMDYSSSLLASDARKRFRFLRGDKLETAVPQKPEHIFIYYSDEKNN